jgi:hypothetical protein
MFPFQNDAFASLESLSKFSVISSGVLMNLIHFHPHPNLAFSITGSQILSATTRAASFEWRRPSSSTIFSHSSLFIHFSSNLYDSDSFFNSSNTSSDHFAGPYFSLSIHNLLSTFLDVILAVSLSHI